MDRSNSDVTMDLAWRGYRQQLRDLPANYTTTDSQPLQEDLSNLSGQQSHRKDMPISKLKASSVATGTFDALVVTPE